MLLPKNAPCLTSIVNLMSRITSNLRTMLVLVAALVVAGAVVRQEREMYRLRTAIAELTNLRSERAAAISTVTNPLPVDTEDLRREPVEVQRLRAEVAQLRREKVERSELQASIDKLAVEVAAMRGILNR